MLDELLRPDRLSQVIEHAMAPVFLLGGVAGFIAIMLGRADNLTRRAQELKDQDPAVYSEREAADLGRRAQLLKHAVFYALCSGIAATLLVSVSFVFAFLNLTHVYGSGGFFLVALALLGVALILFAREIRLSLRDYGR